MTTRWILLAALVACQPAANVSTAAAATETQVEDEGSVGVPASLARNPMEGAEAGPAQAAQSLRQVREGLESLPPERLERVQAAALELVKSCPYNRSAVQIPLVMSRVLAPHDDPSLTVLKAGVAEHVAVLDLLGLTALPLPQPTDYLHQAMPVLHSADQLAATADPIAATMALLMAVRALVDAYPDETVQRIDAAREIIDPATQGQWTLKAQLIGFRSGLEEVAQGTRDPGLQRDTQALVEMLSAYMSLYC